MEGGDAVPTVQESPQSEGFPRRYGWFCECWRQPRGHPTIAVRGISLVGGNGIKCLLEGAALPCGEETRYPRKRAITFVQAERRELCGSGEMIEARVTDVRRTKRQQF